MVIEEKNFPSSKNLAAKKNLESCCYIKNTPHDYNRGIFYENI